ncbi:MAG: acyltransferase [Candidatus Helarchaeota archaeon]
MKELIDYTDRVIGKKSSSSLLYYETVTFFAKNTTGGLGILLRRLLYKHLFSKFCYGIILGENITFRGVKKIEIGKKVKIDNNVLVEAYPDSKGIFLEEEVEIHQGVITTTGYGEKSIINIGKASRIGPYTCIYGHGGIKIGKNVLIAGHNFISASQHIFQDINSPIKNQGITAKGIVIEDDVWIGSNCVIMDGVKIRQGSVIGASSIVNKDIPSYSVAIGQPAKVIKKRGR